MDGWREGEKVRRLVEEGTWLEEKGGWNRVSVFERWDGEWSRE